jgi:hypothetical protein
MKLQNAILEIANDPDCPYTQYQLIKAADSKQPETPEIEKVNQWLPKQLAAYQEKLGQNKQV